MIDTTNDVKEQMGSFSNSFRVDIAAPLSFN